jgi:hypothetical protein
VHFFEVTTDGSDEYSRVEGRGQPVYQLVRIRSNTYIFIRRRDKNKLSFMTPFEFFMLHIPMINTAVTSTLSVTLKLEPTGCPWAVRPSVSLCY